MGGTLSHLHRSPKKGQSVKKGTRSEPNGKKDVLEGTDFIRCRGESRLFVVWGNSKRNLGRKKRTRKKRRRRTRFDLLLAGTETDILGKDRDEETSSEEKGALRAFNQKKTIIGGGGKEEEAAIDMQRGRGINALDGEKRGGKASISQIEK